LSDALKAIADNAARDISALWCTSLKNISYSAMFQIFKAIAESPDGKVNLFYIKPDPVSNTSLAQVLEALQFLVSNGFVWREQNKLSFAALKYRTAFEHVASDISQFVSAYAVTSPPITTSDITVTQQTVQENMDMDT